MSRVRTYRFIAIIGALVNSIAPAVAGSVITPWPVVEPYETLYNREAPVPPQCYTLHEAEFNPCYVCHQNFREGFENKQNDGGLQAAYDFSDVGFTNAWANLFEDRSDRIAAISDAEILEWVREDNYSELAQRLVDANFQGWIPDLEGLEDAARAFDREGFARDGSYWVAYNYKPLPSTFWPTNGATDDVMIRLPAEFRNDLSGSYSRDIYVANLALLEANIKGFDSIGSLPINEAAVGEDVDDDGTIGQAIKVKVRDYYFGAANETRVWSTMYPKGTEFLHTVRYIDVDDTGNIYPSRRMKEVRYMRRNQERNAAQAAYHYLDELLDKEAGRLPRHRILEEEYALESETGWAVSGFMEGADGRLRVNSFEETFFCMGCHNSVGSTVDKTFSFPRKIDGGYGWSYIDLEVMPDAPTLGELRGEIATYLQRVGGGSEFRNNSEMRDRWFDGAGDVQQDLLDATKSIYEIITPSAQRALALNKAYKVIVEDQDFQFGRDPTTEPPVNVYDMVPADAPTLPEDKQATWDIRLDWSGDLRILSSDFENQR